jgi:hypothetical protein
MKSALDPEALNLTALDVIQRHAFAIGALCMYTAVLDRSLKRLIEHLLDDSEEVVACITAGSDAVSQRCELVKRLCYLRSPNKEWRECVVGIMNVLLTGLLPLRNRAVHDDWDVTGDELLQYHRKVAFKSPQSGKDPILSIATARVVSLPSIWEAVSVATDAVAHLTFLGLQLAHWRKTGVAPAPPPKAEEFSRYSFLGSAL